MVFRNGSYVEVVFPLIILGLCSMTRLISIPRYLIGSFTMVLGFSDEYMKKDICGKCIWGALVFAFETVLIKEWLNHNGILV